MAAAARPLDRRAVHHRASGTARGTGTGGRRRAPEPLACGSEVARAAADDAVGVARARRARRLRDRVLPDVAVRRPDGAARRPARHRAERRYYSGIGGTTPQVLVNAAAASSRGEPTWRSSRRGGARHPAPAEEARRAAAVEPQGPRNRRSLGGAVPPSRSRTRCSRRGSRSPMFDNARRAHLGVEPDDYRRQLGEMMAPR